MTQRAQSAFSTQTCEERKGSGFASSALPGVDGGGRRQNGWSCGSLLLALGFDFADQHGWRDGGDGDGAGFGAAFSVEDFALVSGGDDAAERGLRSSHDAHAAD